MMKHIIALIFALTLLSCTKKETLEPEVLPDTYVNPTYYGNLNGYLNIWVGNNRIDTTFSFLGNLVEKSGEVHQYVVFDKCSYNSSVPTTIDIQNNFLDFANHSTWNVQSTYIGSFTHTSNTSTPLIGNAVGLIPSTFSGSHINIELHNITNADHIMVSSFDDGSGGNEMTQTYSVAGQTDISLSITGNMHYLPLNRDTRLIISLWKTSELTVNSSKLDVSKVTKYIYRTKRVS